MATGIEPFSGVIGARERAGVARSVSPSTGSKVASRATVRSVRFLLTKGSR